MNNQEQDITVAGITVSVAMQKAGSDIMAELYDASICKSFGGLGGCREWEDYKREFKGENFDLVEMYAVGEAVMDSTTAAYIAMERARLKEIQTLNPT